METLQIGIVNPVPYFHVNYVTIILNVYNVSITISWMKQQIIVVKLYIIFTFNFVLLIIFKYFLILK